MNDDLDRAIALLGPLEGRVMHAVWAGTLGEAFVVRDVLAHMPELAYTTVMTTVRRLADKGLLAVRTDSRPAHEYRAVGDPRSFLARASAAEASQFVDRYGDAALAAFAARLSELTPDQRQRIQELLP
jgi:predicted transcriptional regulator